MGLLGYVHRVAGLSHSRVFRHEQSIGDDFLFFLFVVMELEE